MWDADGDGFLLGLRNMIRHGKSGGLFPGSVGFVFIVYYALTFS